MIVGRGEILGAMANEERFGISFWDALIVAVGESGGAELVFRKISRMDCSTERLLSGIR
jgi:predicted nucleic acid-binding protein